MPESTNEQIIRQWSQLPRKVVESFGDDGDFTRQHILNPAIFGILGDVRGKTILDAGCGQGYLSRKLARKGAIVTGVEPATISYDYARQREQAEPLGITYLQEDLSKLTTLCNIFDYVIANMVFMDIPDYQSALHNCIASLKQNGSLIFSLLHPCFEESGSAWKTKGYVETRDYFQERAVPQTYGHFFHRPLSAYLNTVIGEGCVLKKVMEPQLDEQIARQYECERYAYVPGYIIIQASIST